MGVNILYEHKTGPGTLKYSTITDQLKLELFPVKAPPTYRYSNYYLKSKFECSSAVNNVDFFKLGSDNYFIGTDQVASISDVAIELAML